MRCTLKSRTGAEDLLSGPLRPCFVRSPMTGCFPFQTFQLLLPEDPADPLCRAQLRIDEMVPGVLLEGALSAAFYALR